MSSMNISENNYNASSIFQATGFTKTYDDIEEAPESGIDFATAAREAINNYVTNANFSAGANFGDISNNNSLGMTQQEIMNAKNTTDAKGTFLENESEEFMSKRVANSAMQASTQSASLNTQMQMLTSMRSF